jgi:pimeloyl-ACP methyl ester carboxylesterase
VRYASVTTRLSKLLAGLIVLASVSVSSRPSAVEKRIDESAYVMLGGIEQFVTIHADDRSKPVVLLIHGGPADVQSLFRSEYSVYEHDFTLVQWDQRGAGKTFGRYQDKTPNVTLAQIVADGVELARYLTRYLNQKRVFVLGHSWGSVVGAGMVQKQPDLFAAFIGTGQVGSWDRGIRYQRDFVRRKAVEAGNQEAIRVIDGIDNFDPTNVQHFLAVSRFLRGYLGKADSDWLSSLRARTLQSATASEAEDIGRGQMFSGPALFPDEIREDLFSTARTFRVPVYIIQGREDVFTPTPVAVDYFNAIRAPSKKLYVIEGAGHFALVTHQNDFLKILREIVR